MNKEEQIIAEILKHKAKSEYKQASIIIIRDVFKKLKADLPKKEIYLDLSKLTKEQQKEIIIMLPRTKFIAQYDITDICFFLSYHTDSSNWWVWSSEYNISKTEINYEQFKQFYPTWK